MNPSDANGHLFYSNSLLSPLGRHYGTARLSARLSEGERAIDWLEQAYSERQMPLTEMGVDGVFDSLRSKDGSVRWREAWASARKPQTR